MTQHTRTRKTIVHDWYVYNQLSSSMLSSCAVHCARSILNTTPGHSLGPTHLSRLPSPPTYLCYLGHTCSTLTPWRAPVISYPVGFAL